MLVSLFSHKKILKVMICLQFAALGTAGQVTPNRRAEQDDDVVRVYTDLVQTDFMVFDKRGRFVEGLKLEDFELHVDGKLQPIKFFEQVRAGTPNEESHLAAARGTPTRANAEAPALLDRGRLIFYFIDDLHLTPSSLSQTTKVLKRFIDSDLKQNDMAQIVTASGRLGILQQLTDNKAVLRKAVERLASRSQAHRDLQRPPMSEFEALQIDRGDRDALGYFVDELLAQNRIMSRQSAEVEVRQRAATLLEFAATSAKATLSSFESFVRNCAKLPGRKLVFLISDGFYIDNRHSDTSERIRTIVSEANHAALVIYSIDARGLIANLIDASSDRAVDRTGRLQRARAGEISQSQDVLHVLARDTGGRALLDKNYLYEAVENGFKETSRYYVAVWRPIAEAKSTNKFRHLEVKVVGKPDVTVRFRRGFFNPPPSPPKESSAGREAKKPQVTPEAKLREAIVAPYENREIPIALSLNYLDEPGRGIALSVSMQIPADFITLESDGGTSPKFDLAGVVYDDQGKLIGSFRERLERNAPNAATSLPQRDLAYSHKMLLQPGLYQVRVAAHGVNRGSVGSANSWIEIPDLPKGEFALSTLLLGERAKSGADRVSEPAAAGPLAVNLKIDRHFQRDSFLRYVVFIYNAVRSASASKPDIVVQVQVFRDDQPVATTPLKPVTVDSVEDVQRIPYAAELPLDDFQAGQYILQFTAVDRTTRRTARQRVRFEIQ